MDSHEMNESPFNTLRRLKFRIVRLNEATLTPGSLVLVGTRHMRVGGRMDFPAQLEMSYDGVLWTAVPFVDAGLVDNEDRPAAEG